MHKQHHSHGEMGNSRTMVYEGSLMGVNSKHMIHAISNARQWGWLWVCRDVQPQCLNQDFMLQWLWEVWYPLTHSLNWEVNLSCPKCKQMKCLKKIPGALISNPNQKISFRYRFGHICKLTLNLLYFWLLKQIKFMLN